MASGATNALRGNSRAGGGEGGIQAWSLDAEAWNFSPHRPLHQPHQLPIRLHRLELRELGLHVVRPAAPKPDEGGRTEEQAHARFGQALRAVAQCGQSISSPIGLCCLESKVLISSPLPQMKKFSNLLNQSPAGTSGLLSSQSRRAMRSAAEICRSLTRSAKWSINRCGRFWRLIFGTIGPDLRGRIPDSVYF